MRPRTLLAVSALASAIALGACGDDDPGISEAGPATGSADSPTTTAATSAAAPGPEDADATEVTCEAGDGGDVDVEISGFTFQPGDVDVAPGDGVTFTNRDPADHSVWSADRVDGEPAFESVGSDPMFRLDEVLHEGDASTCTFPAAGTYSYLCGVHNSMRGTITVG